MFKCYLVLLFIPLVNTVPPTDIDVAKVEHCDEDQTGTCWVCNYIPPDIPQGFTTVNIDFADFDVVCKNTSFQSNSWQQVNTLKMVELDWDNPEFVSICADCFKNLRNLVYLNINIRTLFYLSPDALTGLPLVRSLSFAYCSRLSWDVLMDALNGSDKVPNLTVLDLSNLFSYLGAVRVGKDFADVLSSRNITSLNLSGIQISYFNCTALLQSLKHLQCLNLSSVNLNEIDFEGTVEEIEHVQEVDISDMTLPKHSLPGTNVSYSNIVVTLDVLRDGVKRFFYFKRIFASGIFRKIRFELYHCELVLNRFMQIRTETLVFKNNHLKHIDINVSGDDKYRNASLKHIDISDNQMDFFHPAILSLFPHLLSFRISENNLYIMLKKDIGKFEQFFVTNSKLKIVDLSTNGLTVIPTDLFINNHNLEEIILSNNLLKQIHWNMDNLTKLRIIDIRNNRITNLDSTSRKNLNGLISKLPTSDQLVLKLQNNQISCSQCMSKPFISWLAQTSIVDLSMQNLTCTNENGNQVRIEKSTVEYLESICFQKTIIIVCSLTVGTIFICAMTLTLVMLRYRSVHRKRLKRHQLLQNIEHGEGEYEFVVMMSYNNLEEDFVRHNVLDPLNTTLQTLTGVDRNLVFTGDEHFRPGFLLNNEIASSLERVSLVLLLITTEFCTSGYCLSELDQAWIQRKPMILMFKDEVDEELMTPIMKTIYKKNTRILWALEDGEYVLKTSWDNVCNAILELIIQ